MKRNPLSQKKVMLNSKNETSPRGLLTYENVATQAKLSLVCL